MVELQQRLQHQFSTPSLLARALTHRSFSSDHYERLEFLGDSVLNLAVSDLLYIRLGALPEGDLSRVRADEWRSRLAGAFQDRQFFARIHAPSLFSGIFRTRPPSL